MTRAHPPDTSEEAVAPSRGFRSFRAEGIAVAALLLLFTGQAWLAALRDSVTVDEYAHLPVGLYMWRTGNLGLDPINPPLGRLIAAIPALMLRAPLRIESDFSEWDLGFRFMQDNAERYHSFFLWTRAVTILLGGALGLLVFFWARRWHGRAAGLIALGLYVLSPSVLAHAHLVTMDLPGALGFALTCFFTSLLLERPSAARAAAVGSALGLAALFKLSSVVLVAAIAVLVVARIVGTATERRAGLRPAPTDGNKESLWGDSIAWIGWLAIAATAAILVVNLGYGFQESFAPLSNAKLHPSGALSAFAEAAPWLRFPLPRAMIEGLDMSMNAGRSLEPRYYLAGRLSASGWWYYHLAAFAFKTPLALLAAFLFAFAMWAARRARDSREDCLFVPIVVLFAANALASSLNVGARHVLAAEPLLCIAASRWLAAPLVVRASGERGAKSAARAALVFGAFIGLALANVSVAPRYLQYFNEIAGGPANGHRWLIDSNLDWGQDLIRLREYVGRESIDSVHLAYFGNAHPAIYGIEFTPLEQGAKGIAVVSPTFLMGRPYFWYRGGELTWIEPNAYAWMRDFEPIGRAGSLFVYRLP